uniref:Uncharacterized protein n=1 Tax=Lotus japonicus TaxID=34305 RepID=I3T5R5_LOTJA|nr:unknown [Lotus japonicus]
MNHYFSWFMLNCPTNVKNFKFVKKRRNSFFKYRKDNTLFEVKKPAGRSLVLWLHSSMFVPLVVFGHLLF